MARNRITDRFRKRRRETPLDEARLDDETSRGFIAELLAGRDSGPEAEYACQVVMEELLNAIGELPAEQRDAGTRTPGRKLPALGRSIRRER